MNKNLIIILILIALVGGGFIFVNNSSLNNSSVPTPENSMERLEPQDTSATDKKTDNSSRYVEYSKTLLEQYTDKRRILYFYASWCPTCKPADADFKANAGKLPKDLAVLRVNYNDTDTDQEEKDLAKKYTITYQHTFVQIDSEGKEVAKWNGGSTGELLANIK